MTRIPIQKTRAVLLAVLLITASVAVPISAAASTAGNTPSDPIDGWLDSVDKTNEEDDDGGILSRIASLAPAGSIDVLAAIDGQMDRAISNPFRDIPSNKEQARKFGQTVEENNETIEEKINDETNVTTAYDSHAVIIGHEDGGDAVAVYLVGDVSNGNISNIRVLDEPEFNSTGREIDELWVVDGDAAEDLPELVDTIAERIKDGDALGPSYQRRLGGRYCSLQSPFSDSIVALENCDIRSTMWLDEQSTLEGGDE